MAGRWSRDDALARLRPRLWKYLRAHAAPHAVGTFVEDVWALPDGEFDALLATHLLLDPAADAVLGQIAAVLRRLPSTVARTERELTGVVAGPIHWTRTQQRRIATADPTLFVCRPAARRYDTLPARICHSALETIVDLSRASGLDPRGATGSIIADASDRAHFLRRHPKMTSLKGTRVGRAALNRVPGRWSYVRPIADFLAHVLDARAYRLPAVIEEVFSERLLAPTEPDVLFELEVAFQVVDGLLERGFHDVTPSHLIADKAANRPLARLASTRYGELDLFWQRSPWIVGPGRQRDGGLLRNVLAAAGMRQAAYRPDLILHFRQAGRVVFVEVKLTERNGVAAERNGITEAFAYLLDASGLFVGRPEPHALVVAWNATGEPASARVAVCDQDEVQSALEFILQSTSSRDRSDGRPAGG